MYAATSEFEKERVEIVVLAGVGLLGYGERTAKQRLGLSGAAGIVVEPAQMFERESDAGVLGAERLLAEGQRALEQRFGLGVAAGPLQ